MSKFFFIRVDASSQSGIGHLSRTFSLAVSLRSYGIESIFILDKYDTLYKTYMADFSYIFLYNSNENFANEKSDAILFKKAIKGFKIHGVIVDDYRLSINWEKSLLELNCLLIALDDRDELSHECDIIIDAKWTGEDTINRYFKKTPESCIRLLGPEYILMNQAYEKNDWILTNNSIDNNHNPINIMLNFGGGGDLSLAAELLAYILKKAPKGINFIVQVIIGPFALNKNKILSIGLKDDRVKPVINANSLYDNLILTDLYIGASGGTLYEALSMNIPAITFSIAKNQSNHLEHLEDFSHYFHLNNLSQESFGNFSELVWLVLYDFERIKKLYIMKKKIEIDGLGAKRVAEIIGNTLENGKPYSGSSNKTSFFSNTDTHALNLTLDPIDDSHINKYLDARNRSSNLKNMTEINKVDRLDHYLWWMQNNRSSFILKKGGKPILYIWHQLKTVDNVQILIGGWFTCVEDCSSLDVIYALNWQLNHTKSEFPLIPWVAVIKKTNKFARLLNKRFGFKLISEGDILFEVASQCFPQAKITDFDYLYRK
jgi:spore coat polysaccharide biosynthesis predicted glycosyltransferase SpsG